MNTTVLAIIVMVLVLIGMLIIKKTMSASPMLQPVLFLCVALELGLVIFVFYNQLFGKGEGATRLEKQKRIYYAKGFIAGEELKRVESGKALIILPGGGQNDLSLQELIKGFKAARGGEIVVDELPSGNEGDIQEITPDMVNKVIRKHQGVAVIVFVNTTPENFGSVSRGKAKLFMVDSGSALPSKIKLALGKTVIGVIFSRRNQPKSSEALEKTDREIFDKRFVYIHAGNAAANAEFLK